MSGGTQVTQTTAEPWEAQQKYLEEGFGLTKDLYESGKFMPEFYGAAGTMDPKLAAQVGTEAMPAPGLAGFDPQQHAAMQAQYQYAMAAPDSPMGQAAEQAMIGAGGALPYAQSAMGVGAGMQGMGPGQFGGILPFEGDQYSKMLSGEVDYDAGAFGRMADVYREQAESQMQEGLQNVRQGMVGAQPGGGTRGDLQNERIVASGQKALAQNLAQMYGGAHQQAQAGRMPAAQMGLGAQQFGMGYGLQGMQGAQAGAGMMPGLQQGALGMYGAAQGVGEQQRALNQAAINRDMARYEYQAAQPQQALQSYLAGVSGDYGGMTQSRGAGGTGQAATALAMLAGKFM